MGVSTAKKTETVGVAVGVVVGVDGERVAMWARPKEMELIRRAFAGAPADEIGRLRAECATEQADGPVLADDRGGR